MQWSLRCFASIRTLCYGINLYLHHISVVACYVDVERCVCACIDDIMTKHPRWLPAERRLFDKTSWHILSLQHCNRLYHIDMVNTLNMYCSLLKTTCVSAGVSWGGLDYFTVRCTYFELRCAWLPISTFLFSSNLYLWFRLKETRSCAIISSMTLYLLHSRSALGLYVEQVHAYNSTNMCAQLFSPSRMFTSGGGHVRGDLCLQT